MPALSRQDQLLLGVTPPPVFDEALPPDTKMTRLPKKSYNITRRQFDLSTEKMESVKTLLSNAFTEWKTNTARLRAKLRRANDLMEGMKEPKTFPWEDCSNIHIPIIEIHVTILHSVCASTMLENDPIWYVKILLDDVPENVDNEIEQFLNSVSKIELKIDSVLSDIYWNAYRDGTAIGDLDWVEEYGRQFDIYRFQDPDEFVSQFPTPESAGLQPPKYNAIVKEIVETGESQIKVEETISTYRGPKLRIVELKNLVVIPTTSPDLEYAMIIGDMFLQRGDFFRRKVKQGWFSKAETEKMLTQNGLTGAPDEGTNAQDLIEGISRNRQTKYDEYWCMQGILKYNFSSDPTEPERMYLFVFEPATKAVLRIEEYPYLHNRIKYIIWRFKKRTGRLLGQSIYDQLVDVNDEVDTQHNQRIDSRTISTVPSFLKVDGFEFDPSRKDQRFYPGVTFKVSNFNQVKQFDIKQTDMGQSMQEEQNLMYIAELRTGATSLRGGQAVSKDPRASGKKMQIQLNQSDIRIDDHMRELRIGTSEVATQMLELYYQFASDLIMYTFQDPNTQQFIQKQIARQKLRARDLYIEVARTSVNDNPSALVQRELTIYQMLSQEPMVGMNAIRRRELIVRVLSAMRERNINKILPPVDQLVKELQQQETMNSPQAGQNTNALSGALRGETGRRESPNGGVPHQRQLDTSNGTEIVKH